MPIRERRIPCSDCAQWKETPELRNFRVLGCAPAPKEGNFCVIRFEDPDGRVTAAAASALTSAAAMTPMAAAPVPEANLTATQCQTAQAITNIFETSEVLGDYSQTTVIDEDPGHLTYGRTQTTLASGNPSLLLQRYCGIPGALFGARLQPYLHRAAQRDVSLDHDSKLHNLLRAAADDRVMRETQDHFFNEVYWRQALHSAEAIGITSPLGIAVVYDSHIHGSWKMIRDRTDHGFETLTGRGEQA